MSQINILAILPNHCMVPPGSIVRGKSGDKLKVDFSYDNSVPATLRTPVEEKLKEAKPDGTVTFTKPGETLKLSAELVKEGKPVSKPPKTKLGVKQ